MKASVLGMENVVPLMCLDNGTIVSAGGSSSRRSSMTRIPETSERLSETLAGRERAWSATWEKTRNLRRLVVLTLALKIDRRWSKSRTSRESATRGSRGQDSANSLGVQRSDRSYSGVNQKQP